MNVMCTVHLNISWLRVLEIYALEHVVFYIAVASAIQTINFLYVQHGMFKINALEINCTLN